MSKDLERKYRHLSTLIELSAHVNSTLDTHEIRRRAVEAAATLVDAEAGSLLLVDDETGELFFEVAVGEKGESLKKVRLSKGQGIAGCVAETGEAAIVNDTRSDPRFFRGTDETSLFKTRNMVCAPLKTKDKVIGVLQTINKKNGLFDKEDCLVLLALANEVAIAVENGNRYRELRDAFVGTAAETIEKRAPYTGGHANRVKQYSFVIGKMLGLSGKESEELTLAAILHDIGKIGVRDSILMKNGRLDKEEAAAMERHAEFGSEILEHVRQLKRVVPGVRGHHERYDGTGYPDCLRGEDIPIIARIIAVADTFDAMTTDRRYRKGLSASTAVGELRKYSGTQFDGVVVETFVRYLTETGEYHET